MNTKNALIILVVLIAVALVVGFVSPDLPKDDNTNGGTYSGSVLSPLLHTFKDGTHTVNGVIELPTPCHTISQSIIIAESFPEQVTIDLETNAGDGFCTQVITERGFTAEFDADERASITLRLNGERVSVEIIEAVSEDTE